MKLLRRDQAARRRRRRSSPSCARALAPIACTTGRPSCRCTATTPRTCRAPPSPCASRRRRRRSRRACASPSAHGVPFVARGSGTGLAGGAVPPEGAIVISTTKMNRVLSRRPGRPPGVGRAGRAQPRPDPCRRRPRAALRARPEQPADVLDRRQRRQQLGWAALPGRGRHQRPHHRPRGRAARRHRRPCSAARIPSRSASTCAACSSAARGCSASRRRSASS